MAQENVAKFQEVLRGSEALQAKLKIDVGFFEGDRTDAEAVFNAIIAPLAVKLGLPFTYEECRAFTVDGRKADGADMRAVAGG